MADCNCPKPTSITEIPTQDCPFNMKQIQKYAFQRKGSSFDLAATTPTDIKLLADWQVFRTATDDTKIVVTPYIGADPAIAAGDAITNGGGDNTTLNGIEEVEGKNPSTATATFKSLSPEIEKAMQSLECEDLVVYFLLQGNKLAARQIGTDRYTGFDVQSFFFSDRNNEGFATKDTHNMSFQLPAGYSNDMVLFDSDDLDFSPLVDLT